MKRAETCSCSLRNKFYISLPPYSCVRQVYTLQSSLLYEVTELFPIVELTGTYISSGCITLHAVITVFGNSQFSLPASIPPYLWAVNLVANVKYTKDADRKLKLDGFQIK